MSWEGRTRCDALKGASLRDYGEIARGIFDPKFPQDYGGKYWQLEPIF
jgi:hypothetical protein